MGTQNHRAVNRERCEKEIHGWHVQQTINLSKCENVQNAQLSALVVVAFCPVVHAGARLGSSSTSASVRYAPANQQFAQV